MAITKTPPAKKIPERRKPAAIRTTTEQQIHIAGSDMAEWIGFEPVPVSPEQRRHLIRDAAYFRAARRGFINGDPVQDWLEAEADVDRMLQGEQGSTEHP